VEITVNKRNHKLVIRFMVSYLIIMMVPLLAGFLVYNEARRIVEEDTKKDSLFLLNQCKDIIDKQIVEIDSMNIQVSRNPRLNAAMMIRKPFNPGFYYEMTKLRDELKAYLIGRDFVKTFFVYMKKSHYIISPESAYDADFFFQQAFQSGNKSPDWWLNTVNEYYNDFTLPTKGINLDGTAYQAIPYLQSLPIAYNAKTADGVIVALISMEEIRKLLTNTNISDRGWTYIVDKNKHLLASFSNNKEQPVGLADIGKLEPEGLQTIYLNHQEMLVTFTTSSFNGWKYISIIPTRVVMHKVVYIKKIMWFFVVFSLLVGAIIAYFLTNHQVVKPLKKMIDLLNENSGGEPSFEEDVYKYLQGSISHLIKNNQSLKETVKNHIPLIKTAFIERLLKGGFNSLEEIEAIVNYLGVSLKGEKFLVLLLHVQGFNDLITSAIIAESNLAKVKVKNVLERNIGAEAFIHDENQNSIAILLTFDAGTITDYKTETARIITAVCQELQNTYEIRALFTVGEIYESLLDVWQSYEEAKRVLDYDLVDQSGQGIWYSDIPKQGAEYYYPINFEQQLVNFTKSGDFRQVENILKTIYRENSLTRKLSPEMEKQLTFEMKATLIKMFSLIPSIDEELRQTVSRIDDSLILAEIFERLLKIYENICQAVTRQKKSHNVQLKDKISAYIEQNYQQPDLSLSKVAVHFDLSEGYLSHFFKEQTGENFIGCIENIRINQACKLLADNDLNIEEVAKKVGYSNAYSFRRAFKRVKGINPTAYRSENL
jgi:two-component system, response regulator YesN